MSIARRPTRASAWRCTTSMPRRPFMRRRPAAASARKSASEVRLPAAHAALRAAATRVPRPKKKRARACGPVGTCVRYAGRGSELEAHSEGGGDGRRGGAGGALEEIAVGKSVLDARPHGAQVAIKALAELVVGE